MSTLSTHIHRGERTRTLLLLATLVLMTTGLQVSATAPAVRPALGLEEEEELEGRAPTAIELTPGIPAAFPRESYAPRSSAELTLYNSARGLRLQVFHAGPEGTRTVDNITMHGVAMTTEIAIGRNSGRRSVRVHIGAWPTGLYFAKLTSADGRIGYAPFVVRPRRLGEHRVAVVLPTLTWQAYNLRDMDGDGEGDSWYASWGHKTVLLGRPFLNRGVPNYFRQYDLPFLHWLSWTRRRVDYLSQSDLEAAPNAAVLAKAYDLIVFPGHHEYVSTREYDVVEGYRDRGGNLMFLSANNFFWRIIRQGHTIVKTQQWRELGRPEAALLGVQYRGNDGGGRRGRWLLRKAPAARWIFSGTSLKAGEKFGSGSIEIDQTSEDSPRGTQVLAEIPNLFGPGFTAQMTYYETRRGARVFAAGAFTLAGAVYRPDVKIVIENLWAKLSRP
jgi:N,N-dimethylformamidase beta subunit-like, C-terminal